MKAKKIVFAILMIAIIGVMSGCAYSNNKSWGDLSAKEQQEAKESLDDAREEIKDDFADGTVNFALEILDKLEEAITN